MKIAVLGCGAIGGLFLGYLTKDNKDVVGIVKDYQKEAIEKQGLVIEGIRGNSTVKPKIDTQLREKVDIVIFATKINDLEYLVSKNIEQLKDSILVTTQNGVRADYILNKHFRKESIVTGIVMFGSTFYAPNKIVHNFDGDFIVGNIFGVNHAGINTVKSAVSSSFNTVNMQNIKGAKYLKVFINLNNCIPACLGVSMQEAFSDLNIAALAIKLNKEAYSVVEKSGIELESLSTYPKERLGGLVSMEVGAAAGLFSKIVTSLSKEPLYGSILQSIKRNKKSEIDYINGEIVELAKENKIDAPLNQRIVSLVHEVENSGKFLSKEELLDALNN